jgi:hypothetical protein
MLRQGLDTSEEHRLLDHRLSTAAQGGLLEL